MSHLRTEDGQIIRGFDEAYANALIDGINEESEGQLWIIGYLLADYTRVIKIYLHTGDKFISRYDVTFNAGYNIDQYIEHIINDVKKNHNVIHYQMLED